MKPILEVCANNPANAWVLELEDEFDVMVYGCMNECAFCGEKYYCYIDGDLVFADDLESFQASVKEYMF